MLGVAVVGIVVAVAGVAYYYKSKQKTTTEQKTSHNTVDITIETTEQKTPQHLNGYGILFFSSVEKLVDYARIINCFEPSTTILIRCEEDVEQLPKAKLLILIVEFSERDTILEDRTVGTGYLVRSTVTKLTDREDTFVVVYFRDMRSKKLPDGRLYCKELERKVKENAPLIRKEHFFSVYKHFTNYQNAHLDTIKLRQ